MYFLLNCIIKQCLCCCSGSMFSHFFIFSNVFCCSYSTSSRVAFTLQQFFSTRKTATAVLRRKKCNNGSNNTTNNKHIHTCTHRIYRIHVERYIHKEEDIPHMLRIHRLLFLLPIKKNKNNAHVIYGNYLFFFLLFLRKNCNGCCC